MRYLAKRPNLENTPPSQIQASKALSLDRMRRLLAVLGDPQQTFPAIHVAGSKGKGSVCEMIASGLTASGLGVGLYTSPHLESINERIRVGGLEISGDSFAVAIGEAARAAESFEDSNDPVSYFELLTAAAYWHFANEAVDIAVIEVGMGGRDDATNVLRTLVAVITAIQLEHTQLLGKTHAAIAGIKAGIFKPGTKAVTIPQAPGVDEVLLAAAQGCPCTLEVVGGPHLDYSHRYLLPEGARCREMRVNMRGRTFFFDGVRVPFAGEHQSWNCGLALAAIEAAAQAGVLIDPVKAGVGVGRTPVRGRLEWFSCEEGNGGVWRVGIDGAHTPDSLNALFRTIAATSKHESVVVVFGAAADKDIDGMLREAAGAADKVIFTRAAANRRSADPAELLRRYEALGGGMAQAFDDVASSLEEARRAAGANDVILVCGSYSIAGEARALLTKSMRANTGTDGP